MREKISEKTFEGQSIYVGIDVHRKNWRVSVLTETLPYKTFSAPPESGKLNTFLRKHFPGATYYSVYEAGFSGFWLHRELTRLGINSMVVNPADIPTTDKERKQKEDIRDSRKLAQTLRTGQLRGIHIPSEKTQQDRSLLRVREATVRDLIRVKNRIKAFLYFQGILYPPQFANASHWSNAFLQWLESLPFDHKSGKSTLGIHLESVKHKRSLQLRITRQIRELSQSPEYRENVELLTSVPGIGVLTAMTVLLELEDISRFKNFDNLCSFVGLIPSTHSSGENEITSGITPRKNYRLRGALVESAWVAIRNDTALLATYNHLSGRMPGNKAIIRIAKKLLRRIVSVLRKKEKYEKGIIR
jgi:transposase